MAHPFRGDLSIRLMTVKRSWLINGAFVAGLALFYFGGGFNWMQGRLLGFIAGQPRIEESPINTMAAEDWNWDLRSLDGEFVALSEFAGKPLLLNRWATWCGPCIAEMPFLQNLHEQYGDRISLALVSNEEPETLKKWLDAKGYTMPVYRPVGQAPELFKSRSIPITWLISPQGEMLARHTGAARWDGEDVQRAIDGMLSAEGNP